MTKLTHGFVLEREQEIGELSATARIYRHAKTGARLLSLVSPDENKVFGVAFRTPPSDSTGTPHVLEHSVLCGSRKYPVKEPFVELLKGSLNTFLNALTFPDKTCYPVASANLQDFYNLVDVYLDAVFFPRLTENTLRQEGWHYEAEARDKPLLYKGVVYNEMKGAYSSPDGMLAEYSQRALFPDTCYGLDSGGDPERIPDLSFEKFVDFHRRLYHPANAYAFFSGDDDPEKRLEILDAYFSEFEAPAAAPDSAVGVQAAFAAPRRSVHTYAADAAGAGGDAAKSMCTVNFGLPQIAGDEGGADLALALGVLEHALIGLPSSPLRKALMDSGLGEDVTGGGLETELRQLAFSVGLKGMDASKAEENAAAVERLVLDTLGGLAETGLHPDDVRAALNSVEFDLRENNTGSYPRGLALFFVALSTWIYDGDPLELLPFEAPLARLKDRLGRGEKVFQDLIRTQFLENPHRVLVVLKPDAALGPEREAAEKKRLADFRAGLSDAEMDDLVAATRDLHARQAAPDAPEDLAKIPRLTLADLPRRNARIPQERRSIAGVPLFLHELPTNGVVYLDLGFDLSAVPDELVPLVPILGRTLFEMGTQKTPFADLSRKIAGRTGGIWAQTFVSPVRGSGPSMAAQRLFIRGKATAENTAALLGLVEEILLLPDFSDAGRLTQIILESKARREQRLIPAGHVLAATRLRARLGAAGALNEAMQGLSGLEYVRGLAGRVEKDAPGVEADLHRLLALILTRRGLVANVTAEAADAAAALPLLELLASKLPDVAVTPVSRVLPKLPPREGLCLPALVNYVAAGGNARSRGAEPGPAAAAAVKFLSAGYLWQRVRVQGGAYGASCGYNLLSGDLIFTSYRDPNVGRTLEAYSGVGPHLAGIKLDPSELEKSIIGAVGDIDHYMLPDAKGFTAMARELTGEDEAYRQSAREAVLGADAADFDAFGRAASAVLKDGPIVVAGGREALEASGLGLTLTQAL